MARIMIVAALLAAGTFSCAPGDDASGDDLATLTVTASMSFTASLGNMDELGLAELTQDAASDGTTNFSVLFTDIAAGPYSATFVPSDPDYAPIQAVIAVRFGDNAKVITFVKTDWSDEINDLSDQIADANSDTQARLDALQQQLDAMTDAMGAGDANLLAAIQALTALVEALQTSVDANSDQMDQNQQATLAAIAALEALVNGLSDQVDQNQQATIAAIAALQAIVDQLALDVAANDVALLAAIQALTALVEALQTDLDAVSDQLTDQAAVLTTIEADLANVTAIVTSLGTDLDALSDQVDAGNTALSAEITAAQASLDALSATVTALQQQIADMFKGNLDVTVLTEGSGSPAADVLVQVTGSGGVNLSCTTATPTMICSFTGLNEGRYTVTASKSGFETQITNVNVIARATETATLFLPASGGGGPVAGDLVPQPDFVLLGSQSMTGTFRYYDAGLTPQVILDANTTMVVQSGTSATIAGMTISPVSSGNSVIQRCQISTAKCQTFTVVVP